MSFATSPLSGRTALARPVLASGTRESGTFRSATLAAVTLSLVVLLAACTEPPPPPPEVMMESEDPSAPFVGTWDLVDWRIVEPSGEVVFPWGEDPRGQIVYTREGRMSAHLMSLPTGSPDAGPPEGDGDSAVPADGFQDLSYWGSFTVDPAEGTVVHHVTGSSSRSWVGSDQVRGFEFLGADRILLTAPGGGEEGAGEAPHRLTWVRVR